MHAFDSLNYIVYTSPCIWLPYTAVLLVFITSMDLHKLMMIQLLSNKVVNFNNSYYNCICQCTIINYKAFKY